MPLLSDALSDMFRANVTFKSRFFRLDFLLRNADLIGSYSNAYPEALTFSKVVALSIISDWRDSKDAEDTLDFALVVDNQARKESACAMFSSRLVR